MVFLLITGAIILGSFAFVLLFGAPYLPTLSPQIKAALDLADLKPGETLLELGCGDGRVLVAAAERGWKVIGYELNPFLALVAWLRTRRFRRQVRVVWGNFWSHELPAAQAVFVFLLKPYMARLDAKLEMEGSKPLKLVSFAFQVPGRKPLRSIQDVFLYRYQ